MARTLFFIEALIVAAIAAIYPLLASSFAASVLVPLAISLILPLAASLAVRPGRVVFGAMGAAFSGRRPPGPRGEAEAVMAELASYARIAAVCGLLASLAVAFSRLGNGTAALTWLLFGAFLCLYCLLEAVTLRILALVVEGLRARPANADLGEAMGGRFKEKYGLSPREWETATAIASGSSYKETAETLGVSLATVKAHLASVYRKTGVRDKLELVLLIRQEKGETGPY
jgi:DNA-binding CsgD family transcriptional regulator